jgi:hypothetical protein
MNQEDKINGENLNNHQENSTNENININDANGFFNDYIRNIHQQILQYRGMLKQLSGQGKLTNNNKASEKSKIKKAIATLQNMLTNPQLIQKRLQQSMEQQMLMNEYMKQLEAKKDDVEKTTENVENKTTKE